jgi:predicted ATPase/tRNA A-37 threonylcarbamoyl transferase component Bud32/Tfp pilus assembly protein PilF
MDDLVASVSEGSAVDWAGAESDAIGEEERLRLSALHSVAQMADFNRGLQRSSQVIADSAPAGALGSGSAAGSGPPPLFRWGHLEVRELVGRGSFGEVYRAIDTRLQREVALKLRRTETATPHLGDRRFLTEARDLARVRHPNVIVVYGADTYDRQIGFWTEFIRGQTLADRLTQSGPCDEVAATQIGVDLCRALGAVHAAGLVHGDVKVANAMVEESGRIVLMDFGAARLRGEDKYLATICSPLTTAPEILEGDHPRPTADLYSLGSLLFQLVTGRTPFVAETMRELRDQQEQGRRPLLNELRSDLSGGFVTVVERALSLDPDRRYQSAAEMESAFRDAQGTPVRAQHSLPAELDFWFGREQALADLGKKFEGGARLVTLLGPAGMGKTRLAVHYGWSSLVDWPGGVWFADLSEAQDQERVVSLVAGALGVPLGRSNQLEQLGRAIAARGRCLVVLDNFELVVSAAEGTVGRWLELAPEARFLVTSRERLRVRGESIQIIEPLATSDAVDLFGARARQQQPECDLEGPAADSVRELVTILDGLPLAIELAAARIQVMTPAEMVARMRDRFRVLGSGGKAGALRSHRHSTLEAAIDSSWELLEPWEQAALAQCAVFQGGFTLEAAENVLDLSDWPEAPWVVDVVQALVDKSLLRMWVPATSGHGPEAMGRIGMYASLQEYAGQKLCALGPQAEAGVEERHGQWYARFGTEEAIAGLDVRGGVGRSRRLMTEFDNLRTACQRAVGRGDGQVAARTLRASNHMLILTGRGNDRVGVDLAKEVAAMPLSDPDLLETLLCLGRALRHRGKVAEAHAVFERTLALSQKLGDRKNEGIVLGSVAGILQQEGRMDEALAAFESALALHRETGDPGSELIATDGLGIHHLLQGRMPEAQRYLESALQMARAIGSRSREGTQLGNLAIVAAEQGRMDQARSLYESALAISREAGDRRGESNDLGNIANLLSDQGLLTEARTHYEHALVICREIGDRVLEGILLGNLGTIEMEEGRFALAQDHITAALAIAREMSNRRSEGYAHGYLGSLHREEGRTDQAHVHLDASIAIAKELANLRMEGVALGSLGAVLGDEGRYDDARAAFARGESILKQLGDQAALGTLLCNVAGMEFEAGEAAAGAAAHQAAEALAEEIGATPGSYLSRRLAELRVHAGG